MCEKCGIPLPEGVCPTCFEVDQITIFKDTLLIDFNNGNVAAFRTFKKSKDFKVVEAGV